MTDTLHHSHAPLPTNHAALLAYVQLYGAYMRNDGQWPAQAFTAVINTLVARRHAAPVYARHRLTGYVLTERGRAFWHRYNRLKSGGLTIQPKAARHDGARGPLLTPRAVDMLRGLIDGQWHDPRTVSTACSSVLKTMRDRVVNARYAEEKMIGKIIHLRLTDAGRAFLEAER